MLDVWHSKAVKGLRHLGVRRDAMVDAVHRFAAEDPTVDVVPMINSDYDFRIRVGGFRALVTIDRAADELTVWRVGPRGDIYD